jgi:hypothetical protein
MKLHVSKLVLHHQGWDLSVEDAEGSIKKLATLNGNKIDEALLITPSIVFSIDAHVLYGVSHPEIISQILTKGPQPLLTTKELGHRMFEHGMKAALGKLKVGNNVFNTTLETFYEITQETKTFSLIPGTNEKCACLVKIQNYKPVLLTPRGFIAKSSLNETYKTYIIEDVSTVLTIKLQADEQ